MQDERFADVSAAATRAHAAETEAARLGAAEAALAADGARLREALGAAQQSSAAFEAQADALRGELAEAQTARDDLAAEAERLRRTDVSDVEHAFSSEVRARAVICFCPPVQWLTPCALSGQAA